MTMGSYRDGWNHAMEEEALPRIKELEAALRTIIQREWNDQVEIKDFAQRALHPVAFAK